MKRLGAGNSGTSPIRCHGGRCRWSRRRLWHLIPDATSPLDKAPPSVMQRGTGGLGTPTPPQASLGSLLGLEPPSSPTSAPSPQGPGPPGLAVTPPSFRPQAGLWSSAPGGSGWGWGAKPRAWRPPNPDPGALGPRPFLAAPTCVSARGTSGRETGREQLQVKDPPGAHT